MDMDKLKDAINELFVEFTNEHSIIIILFLVGALLIGLLFGWWQGRRGKRKLKKALKQKESELITLQAEHTAVQEQLGLKEADLTKANLEVEELKTNISQIEHEKAQLRSELYETSTSFEKIKTENEASVAEIESLNAAILTLEANSAQQAQQLEQTVVSDVDISEVKNNYDTANLRLAAIEEKLSRMERENFSLKEEISAMKDTSSIEFVDDEPTETDEEIEVENVEVSPDAMEFVETEDRSVLARQKLQEAFGNRISIASPNEKDDLKKINGIGPFIEQKLNDIGIYTFKQISEFDNELVEQVTDAIQFFPGRINRDDWVGQAKQLK